MNVDTSEAEVNLAKLQGSPKEVGDFTIDFTL